MASFTVRSSEPTLVVVTIRESLDPVQRGKKYEDPLEIALAKAKVGEISGGGTLFSKSRTIEAIQIDVDLTDLKKGIPLLKRELIRLGAPKGTTIEYEYNEKEIHERL